jgi:polyisoprenoid-binding protein YceI
MTKRTLALILGIPLALVLAVSAATFVYIHVVNGDQPAALTVDSVTSTTAGGTTASTAAAVGSQFGVDGTWNLTSGSVVGYRVKETLFGQSGEAVGRTSSITGTVSIAGSSVTAAKLSVDLTTVASNESQRDGQFQNRIMNTSRYPTATFELTSPIGLGSVPSDGVQVTAQATGDLTLHGTTKRVAFTVTAKKTGSTIAIAGSIPVTFADYGINNPSGGPASVGNGGTMEFALRLSR